MSDWQYLMGSILNQQSVYGTSTFGDKQVYALYFYYDAENTPNQITARASLNFNAGAGSYPMDIYIQFPKIGDYTISQPSISWGWDGHVGME